MSKPQITVCIVTYNQHDFIDTCVRSIAEQQVDAQLHILVGDDASTDGTSEIVAQLAAEHPGLIRHICRDTRMGPFENLRDLIAMADGEYIARVDGDDFWLPGKLAQQLAVLEAHSECVAVYTNAIAVDEAGRRIGLFTDVGDMRFDLAAMLRRGNFLNNSSVLFRSADKRAWTEVTEPQIDFRIHLRLARHGWLAHLGEPLAGYRVSARGSMVSGMNESVRELYWDAIQSVPRGLVSDGDYARGLADFLRRVVFRAIRTRDGALLRNWTKRVFGASPYGRMRTTVLTLGSILRILGKEAAGLFQRDAAGKRQRILYRR